MPPAYSYVRGYKCACTQLILQYKTQQNSRYMITKTHRYFITKSQNCTLDWLFKNIFNIPNLDNRET